MMPWHKALDVKTQESLAVGEGLEDMVVDSSAVVVRGKIFILL